MIKALLTIVSLAGPLTIAAASPVVSEDVPVPGGTTALARAVGIAPVPDRARFVAELARLIYTESKAKRQDPDSKYQRLIGHLRTTGEMATPSALTDLVPMPLPAAVWSEAVFRRPVAPSYVFAAVMSDSAAALLAYGLAALDDETLQFLIDHPAVITRLYEHDASVFAAFAEHVKIHGNRAFPPGGDRAVPLWEALLNETVAQPDRFVRQLFARDEGRIAYLYDTVGHLDPSRAAFALGFWIEDPNRRVDRFKALASAATTAFREWQIHKLPFTRPSHDLLSMLVRVRVAATGEPGFPAQRRVWARAFGDDDAPGDSASEPKTVEDDALIDAAWLTQSLVSGDPRSRMERLDQFAFGHRVFAIPDPLALPDVIAALRAFPRCRMLMLTLERIGIGRPSVYAALARQAKQLSGLDASRARTGLAQFQGAIALVARLASVRSIDRSQAEQLLTTLGAVPFIQDGYSGAVAPWLQLHLRPALAAGHDLGATLVEALAGAPAVIPASPVSWEGQQYQFDLVASETRRLRGIRELQGAHSIDAALALHERAQSLAPHETASLIEHANTALGEALVALSYAVALAEPASRTLATTLARRHDFGLDATDADTRMRTAWAQPTQMIPEDGPRHVRGSILGLDIALASFGLRRISSGPLTSAPTLISTEHHTFATSLALMDPFALQDADRDAIADAIARGQGRLDTLTADGSELEAVAREIAMDGWRLRALRWMIRHDSQRIRSMFSMTELLYLGGEPNTNLHPWGMSALTSLGCICTRLAAPARWAALIGRPQLGLLATTVADLNLHVAVMLRELQLPAALAKFVLGAAVQDFVDHVRPSYSDDWLTLVRTAQSVSRDRIEDYVAAATAGGPLVPDTSATPRRVP